MGDHLPTATFDDGFNSKAKELCSVLFPAHASLKEVAGIVFDPEVSLGIDNSLETTFFGTNFEMFVEEAFPAAKKLIIFGLFDDAVVTAVVKGDADFFEILGSAAHDDFANRFIEKGEIAGLGS